jgi:hypothetical protein
LSDAWLDVWDVGSFDEALLAELNAAAELIRDFHLTSDRQWREREASDHTMPQPENPYAEAFISLAEHIMTLMERRSIRAWHYTRMADDEIALVRKEGIRPSTLATILERIDARIERGTFSMEVGQRLLAETPFRGDQLESRSGKFYMVSHPLEPGDDGVEDLLRYWGGESIYFRQRDDDLLKLLEGIGRPRVMEVRVPLARTRHAFRAAETVVASFARSLGCEAERKIFDLYVTDALASTHVLAIHSEGEPMFEALGREYPSTLRQCGPLEPNEAA